MRDYIVAAVILLGYGILPTRGNGICSGQTPLCLNGGVLRCSVICNEGAMFELSCECECLHDYYGVLCELKRPCLEEGHATGAMTTESLEPDVTTTEPREIIDRDHVIIAAGSTYGVEMIHFASHPHYTTSHPVTHGRVVAIDTDWDQQVVYYSFCCNVSTGISRMYFNGTSSDPIYTTAETDDSVRALGVDGTNDLIFFYEIIFFTGESFIRRMTTHGDQLETIYTAPCDYCISTIQVDPQASVFYYINEYEAILYRCDYDGNCSYVFSTGAFDTGLSCLDTENDAIYYYSGLFSGGAVEMHKYDFTTMSVSLLGILNDTESVQNELEGITIRGDQLFLKPGYCNNGAWEGRSFMWTMPTSGGDVIQDSTLDVSCSGLGLT